MLVRHLRAAHRVRGACSSPWEGGGPGWIKLLRLGLLQICAGPPAPNSDNEDEHVHGVLCWLLTTARRSTAAAVKNVKVSRLGLKELEGLANEKASASKASRLAKEQARASRRLTGLPLRPSPLTPPVTPTAVLTARRMDGYYHRSGGNEGKRKARNW